MLHSFYIVKMPEHISMDTNLSLNIFEWSVVESICTSIEKHERSTNNILL